MSRKKRSVHRYTPYTPIYSTSNDLPNVSSWVEWKQFYQRELANDKYGYETKFIDLVLSQVNNIIPPDVRYQYHFKDGLLSKNRFIDFLILNQEKGYCLAIELDGYGKMLGNATGDSKDYDKFNDFMVRQNSLLKALYNHNETSKFNIIILRYTNKYFLNNTYSVIREIVNTLYLQANLYSSRLVIKKDTINYEQQINEYRHDAIFYKGRTNHLEELVGSKDSRIKELEIQIAHYQYQLENSINDTVVEIDEVGSPSTNLLFEPSEIILANNQLGDIEDVCEDTDCNTDTPVLRVHLTDTGYAFEDLTEKDLLIEKLKSENAKLKWVEMKYKELTETKEVTQKEPVATVNNVTTNVGKPLTSSDDYEIVFTQKEEQALAEIFKDRPNEIDWKATRKALSKQPNRLQKVEQKAGKHWDSDNYDGKDIVFHTFIAFLLVILFLLLVGKSIHSA